MLEGKVGFCDRFLPREIRGIITEDMLSDIGRLDTAILALLRTKTADELKTLPDISEGIENKLYFSINVATDLEELYNKIKTKRYTLARVRRLVLSAFLGIDGRFFMTTPPYVRLLGFSKKGEGELKNIKSLVPVVTRAAQIKQLHDESITGFETECRASDLYALSFKKPLECGLEYKIKLLKTECLE
jgi:predicted nucleotidyltransferase